jgi:hypothetical protein
MSVSIPGVVQYSPNESDADKRDWKARVWELERVAPPAMRCNNCGAAGQIPGRQCRYCHEVVTC